MTVIILTIRAEWAITDIARVVSDCIERKAERLVTVWLS